MLNFIKNFRNDEDGAVTVDWVVLTAAIVVLAGVVGATVFEGVNIMGTTISTELASQSVGDTAGTTVP